MTKRIVTKPCEAKKEGFETVSCTLSKGHKGWHEMKDGEILICMWT